MTDTTKYLNIKGRYSTVSVRWGIEGDHHNGKVVLCVEKGNRADGKACWIISPTLASLDGRPYTHVMDNCLVPFPDETEEDRQFILDVKADERVGALKHVFRVPEKIPK